MRCPVCKAQLDDGTQCGRCRADLSALASVEEGGRPAEQHFPVPIVVAHGLAAATTLVLVLLASAGVGGS